MRELDPSVPLPKTFESAATATYYVVVGYDKELVLHWLRHFDRVGDRGYILYRISHFTDPDFNFMDYNHQFGLPESSMAQVYMQVSSRLNDWARSLELPYRYEVSLQEGYMGYQENNDSIPIIDQQRAPLTRNASLWKKLIALWRA